MPKNTFKAALSAGDTQIGLWGSLCSMVATEISIHAGFDFIMFDTEHSPMELASLYPHLQAAAGSGTHAAVRLDWNDRVLIKRALDIGAQTIMVPYVQSAEEARAAVISCAYPPDGLRGVAGGTRASRYGRDKSYLSTARDEICLLVQVETREAMERLDEIAAVAGVDGVFIGPSDLAASMGHLGNPGHDEVQAALQSAVERLSVLGVPAGILAVTEPDAKRYRDWGYRFIAAGVDAALLTRAVDGLAAAMKPG